MIVMTVTDQVLKKHLRIGACGPPGVSAPTENIFFKLSCGHVIVYGGPIVLLVTGIQCTVMLKHVVGLSGSNVVRRRSCRHV